MPGTIDKEVLERYRVLQEDGEPDLVAELIEIFEADLPERLEAIRKAVAEGSADATRRAAHALKGSAATIGAVALSALAADLERQAIAGETAGAADRLTALEARAFEAVVALRRVGGGGRS